MKEINLGMFNKVIDNSFNSNAEVVYGPEFLIDLDMYQDKFLKDLKKELMDRIESYVDHDYDLMRGEKGAIEGALDDYHQIKEIHKEYMDELIFALTNGYKVLAFGLTQYADTWVIPQGLMTIESDYITGDNRRALKAVYLIPVVDYKRVDRGIEFTLCRKGKTPNKWEKETRVEENPVRVRVTLTVKGSIDTMSKYKVEVL